MVVHSRLGKPEHRHDIALAQLPHLRYPLQDAQARLVGERAEHRGRLLRAVVLFRMEMPLRDRAADIIGRLDSRFGRHHGRHHTATYRYLSILSLDSTYAFG